MVVASTGRDSVFPANYWRPVYQIDLELNINDGQGEGVSDSVVPTILHNEDDLRDFGIHMDRHHNRQVDVG